MVPGLKRAENPERAMIRSLREGAHPEDVLRQNSEIARRPEFWEHARRTMREREPKDVGLWMAAFTKAATSEKINERAEEHIKDILENLIKKGALSRDQMKRVARLMGHRYTVLEALPTDILKEVLNEKGFVAKHPEKAANIILHLAKRSDDDTFHIVKAIAEENNLHEHIKESLLKNMELHPRAIALAFSMNLVKDPEFARHIYRQLKQERLKNKIKILESVAKFDVKDPESAFLAAALFKNLIRAFSHEKRSYSEVLKNFVQKIQRIAEEPGNENFKHAVLHLAGAHLAHAAARDDPEFAAWISKELIQNYDPNKMKEILKTLEELTGEKARLDDVEKELATRIGNAMLLAVNTAARRADPDEIERVMEQVVKSVNELAKKNPSEHFMWYSGMGIQNLASAAMAIPMGTEHHGEVFRNLVNIALAHPKGAEIVSQLISSGNDVQSRVIAARALRIIREAEKENRANPVAIRRVKNILGIILGRKIE